MPAIPTIRDIDSDDGTDESQFRLLPILILPLAEYKERGQRTSDARVEQSSRNMLQKRATG